MLPTHSFSGKTKHYLGALNQYRNWHYGVSNNIKNFKKTISDRLDFKFDGQAG